MDNVLLIILLGAIIVFGFAIVVMFNRFFNKSRKCMVDNPERPSGGNTGDDAELLDKFERTGMMDFDYEDSERRTNEDDNNGGLE